MAATCPPMCGANEHAGRVDRLKRGIASAMPPIAATHVEYCSLEGP